ncbi:MAG: hypothetical protein E6G90_19415 [Alphaproteobacteria bacterium]|nr:MAG: hypothetical protein E6G90_19415 [Alphaproteobacteria bacterium]
MDVVDRDQNSGCDDDHAAQPSQQPVLNERKIGTERGDLTPEFSAKRGFRGLQIRLRRNILVDRVDDFRRNMLCGVTADAAFFEGARQGKSIGHLLPCQITASERVSKKCRRSGFSAKRKRS